MDAIKEIDQVKGSHPTKNRAFPKRLRFQMILNILHPPFDYRATYNRKFIKKHLTI